MQIIDIFGGGGAERVAIDLIVGLDKSRFEVTACATRQEGPYARELEEAGIRYYCLNRQSRFDFRGFLSLLRILRRENPQIVHTHKFGSNVLGRIAAIITGVPVIIAHEHNGNAERPLLVRNIDRILATKTAKIITCDTTLERGLIKNEGLPPNKVTTIFNGIQITQLHPTIAPQDIPEGVLIGMVARLEPPKDQVSLLKAFPAILAAIPDAQLLIIGRGLLLEKTQSFANELGIAERVHFLGFRKDIAAILDHLDVFVLASHWEGLPLSVLEAMAHSLPVVCSDVGSCHAAVEHGTTGFLVPPGQPDALADAILKILQAESLAAQFGKAGLVKVTDEFSLQRMVHQMEVLYQTLYRQTFQQQE